MMLHFHAHPPPPFQISELSVCLAGLTLARKHRKQSGWYSLLFVFRDSVLKTCRHLFGPHQLFKNVAGGSSIFIKFLLVKLAKELVVQYIVEYFLPCRIPHCDLSYVIPIHQEPIAPGFILISFPDLAGGRSRRRDLVKSDLYHVIACQECGRQVNSACPRQF